MTDTTPTPGVLSPERLLAEARDEALDAVMYLGARLASLLGVRQRPVIEWMARLYDHTNALFSSLCERDRVGSERYGVQLMITPVATEATPDELQRAERLYRAAVEFAAMFVEGA